MKKIHYTDRYLLNPYHPVTVFVIGACNATLIRARPVATCEPVPPAPITKTVTGW